MNQPEGMSDFRRQQRLGHRAGTTLVILLLCCLALTFGQIVYNLSLAIHSYALLQVTTQNIWFILAVLVTLEAFYSYNRLNNEEVDRNKNIYRLSEIVLMLFILKLLLYILSGFQSFFSDLQVWEKGIVSFIMGFFSAEYVVLILPLGILWGLSTFFASNLAHMQVDEEEAYMENPAPFQIDRFASRQSMISGVMVVGIFMAFWAAISHYNEGNLGGVFQLTGGSVLNLVIYFVLAITLFSLTQFNMLGGRWFWFKAPVQPHLGQRWLGYSLLFLVLVGLLALLLPTRYTVGFLETLRYAISFVLGIFGFFITVLLFLVARIFSWFMSLLCLINPSFCAAPTPPLTAAEPSMPNFVPSQTGNAPSWLEVLRSLIFWVVILGGLTYLIRYYFLQNRTAITALKRVPLIGWLVGLWRGLFTWMGSTNRWVKGTFIAGLQRFTSRPLPAPPTLEQPFFNPGRLQPRERVIYFYLKLIQRGEQAGVIRKNYQTPSEYQKTFTESFPEVKEDVSQMTEVFNDARYSRHEIEPERALSVQNVMKHIMSFLRGTHLEKK